MDKTKIAHGKFDKSNEIYLRIKKGDKTVRVLERTTGKLDDIKNHINKAISLLNE